MWSSEKRVFKFDLWEAAMEVGLFWNNPWAGVYMKYNFGEKYSH